MNEITNGTIKRLKERLDAAKGSAELFRGAKKIAYSNASHYEKVKQIMALGINDETLARALLDTSSLMYQTQNMAISTRTVRWLEKELAKETELEKQRMIKRGLL